MKDAAAVSELTLERYRLGELPAAEMRAVREALAADAGLRERLAAIESSDLEILAAQPPAAFAASVERRIHSETAPGPTPARPWWSPAPAWALALGLVAASLLLLRGDLPAPHAGGDRAKGGAPSLLLFRQGPGGAAERLDPGAVAHARDVMQLAYHAAGHRYGVIVSIDGRGVVTRHLPPSGDEAAALQAGGPALLPTAYRLDDAPRLERFYLVTADAPFAVTPVLTAARGAAADPVSADRLPLPAPFAQASFLLRKD
jgi:hypothetical protein